MTGSARVTIDGAACLAVASPLDACRRRVDLCPTQAITLAERQIAAAAEQCVGCGRCAAVCPTEVIGAPCFAAVPSGLVECASLATMPRFGLFACTIELAWTSCRLLHADRFDHTAGSTTPRQRCRPRRRTEAGPFSSFDTGPRGSLGGGQLPGVALPIAGRSSQR